MNAEKREANGRGCKGSPFQLPLTLVVRHSRSDAQSFHHEKILNNPDDVTAPDFLFYFILFSYTPIFSLNYAKTLHFYRPSLFLPIGFTLNLDPR